MENVWEIGQKVLKNPSKRSRVAPASRAERRRRLLVNSALIEPEFVGFRGGKVLSRYWPTLGWFQGSMKECIQYIYTYYGI